MDELRPIPGYPGYSVTNDGRIWSDKRGGRWLSSQVHSNDFDAWFMLSVDGKQKAIRAHRAVLYAWVGPCPKDSECRHIDGDNFNNHVSNLRWAKVKGNRLRLRKDALLDDDKVKDIRKRVKAGESQANLGREYGTSRSTISNVVLRQTWKYVH